MARYKVPQDVEADDKLLGPFSFRQCVYILIAGILIAMAVGLFQIFPALVIIPLPPALFLLILALPLKKDQPMETYVAALISYWIKPRKRVWTPGQRNSTIEISAPKIVEAPRTRNLTSDEATHRLSFLASIVDTEGRAINGESAVKDDINAEAAATPDIFETSRFSDLGRTMNRDENARRAAVVSEMRSAIEENSSLGAPPPSRTTIPAAPISAPTSSVSSLGSAKPTSLPRAYQTQSSPLAQPEFSSAAVVRPTSSASPSPQPSAKSASASNPAVPHRDLYDFVSNLEAKNPTTHAESSNSERTANESQLGKTNLSEKSTAKSQNSETATVTQQNDKKSTQTSPSPKSSDQAIIDLATNSDYSIATIQKEASRINKKNERQPGEVFISLH